MREAGICPICGEEFDSTETAALKDGPRCAFYVHPAGSELVSLCVERPDGTKESGAFGRREVWIGQ